MTVRPVVDHTNQGKSCYANCTLRYAASIVDSLIIICPVKILAGVFGSSHFLKILGLIIQLVYWPSFESSSWRASPGKRFLKIYVADEAGNTISPVRSLIRYLITLLPMMPVSILLSTDEGRRFITTTQPMPEYRHQLDWIAGGCCLTYTILFWLPIVFTKEKTGLHDFLTKTRVYRLVNPVTENDRSNLSHEKESNYPSDLKNTIEDVRHSAESGDVVSQYKIGKAYAEGDGVRQDYSEAIKWYRKAAERGHATSQSTLGRMFFMGEGTSSNNEEAYYWYSLAAKSGKPQEWARSVARYLKPDQIASINKRVADWKPKSG